MNPPLKNGELAAALQENEGRLRAFIRRRVPSWAEVEDILQEVSYNLVRVNSLLQPIEQISAWLFKAARNEIIDRSRKKSEQQLPEGGEDWLSGELAEIMFGQASSSEDEYLSSLFWQELDAALDELSPAQREIFELTELQGKSFKEIAEASGENINTLLSHKRRAVLHLRASLEGLYQDIVNS